MIEINKLCKKYKSATGEVIAVDNVCLNFRDTGLVFILGKSGSGKTSLLNLMAGLDKADSGSIQALFLKKHGIPETDVLKLNTDQLDIYHNLCMGFVFQDNCLIDNWSVKDNITISLLQQETPSSTENPEERVMRILEYVDMGGLMNRRVSELSAGQVQRVAIARALIKDPNVIFADEPTGNLDVKTSRIIFDILKEISKRCLVVVVTHDEKSAYEYGDRVVKMSDGKIVDDGIQNELDIKFELFVRGSNDMEEKSIVTSNLENIRAFICDKVINNISKEHSFRLETFRSAKHEKRAIENIETRAKNIPFISIINYALFNFKGRIARLLIIILILSLTLLFYQVVGHLYFARVGQPISEYLLNNYIDEFFLKDNISYYDEYKERHYVTCGDSTHIIEHLDSACASGQSAGCISQANVTYGDNEVSALLCAQASEYDLIQGLLPRSRNEICITDYIAFMLGLDNSCINSCLSIFNVDFYVCGIINTDYEDTKLLERSKIGKQTEMDIYNVEYIYTKILCDENFLSYLCDNAQHISVKSSDFTKKNTEAYLSSYLNFASINSVEDSLCLYGRLPKAVNEILVSFDFAVEHNLLVDDKFTGERKYSFQDIHSARYNGAYDGVLNIHSILPDVLVVGVAVSDNATIDVWVDDEIFNTIKSKHYSTQLFDVYQISISDEPQSDLADLVDSIYAQNLYIDEPNIMSISQLYELRNQFYSVAAILLIVFFVLIILLEIMFITYNVKDNRCRIGILMALGVRKTSIVQIYICESVLVSIVAYAISLVSSATVFIIINEYFRRTYELDVSFFKQSIWMQLGVLIFVLILGIATVFLPILSMSKERPIKLIKD